MYIGLYVKWQIFFSDFNKNLNFFFGRFSKNNPISNFMKLRPLEAEFFHADGRTGRQADMMKQFCERT